MRTRTLKLVSLALPLTAFAVSGCLPRGGGQNGQHPGGGDDSLLASLGGLNTGDMTDSSVGFKLHCRGPSQTQSNVELVGKRVGEESIKFDANSSQVRAKDKCWLEITIDHTKEPMSKWTWLGLEKGQTKPGLMYGSNEGEVTDQRTLALTVFRLYQKPGEITKAFTAVFNVAFEENAEKPVPADDKIQANLVCNGASIPGGKFVKTDGKKGKITFDKALSADVLKGKACRDLNVGWENTFYYSADITDADFGTPEANSVKTFDKEYVLKFLKNDGLTTTTEMGDCVKFDKAATPPCSDRSKVTLPWEKTFYVAKVQGKRAPDVSTVYTYYVAMEGFVSDKAELTAADITAAIPKYDQTPTKKLVFYKAGFETAFATWRAKPFNADFVAGSWIGADLKATAAELAGLKLTHLEEVWVHGFRDIAEADLNKLADGAYWLAEVTAKKDGKTDENFLVTGTSGKYFHSAARPLADKYLDLDAMITDVKDKGLNWMVYGIKGKPMANASCALEAKDYTAGAAGVALTGTDLKPAAELAGKIDTCEVHKAEFTTDFTGYTKSATYKVWDWYQAK